MFSCLEANLSCGLQNKVLLGLCGLIFDVIILPVGTIWDLVYLLFLFP